MPALGAVAAGVGLVKGVGGLFDHSGENTFRAGNYGDTPQYNPNDFEYGGDPGSSGYAGFNYMGVNVPGYAGRPSGEQVAEGRAEGLGSRFGNFADTAQGRAGVTMDPTLMDQSRGMSLGARGSQSDALQMFQDRAAGRSQSIAQMQANQALGQSLNDQATMAASARGGAGAQALASRSAMAQGAQLQGNIAGSSAIAAAQERLAAQQAYFGAASGMRGQDIGQQQADYARSAQNAQLEAEQRRLNDQMTLGMSGYQLGSEELRNRIAGQGMQGRMGRQETLAGSANAGNAVNAQINQANANYYGGKWGQLWDSVGKGAQAGGAAMGGGGGGA